MNKLLFAGVSLALLMTACASSSTPDDDPADLDVSHSEALPPVPPDDEGDTTLANESGPPTLQTLPETLPGDYGGALAVLVAVAIADLTERLSVTDSEIAVVSAESVVWPDGSLGCPIPGMRYTQVQIDGARLVLAHGGIHYMYHSGGGREPFLCVPGKLVPDTDSSGKSSLPTTTIGLDE